MPCGLSKVDARRCLCGLGNVIIRRHLCGLSNANARQQRSNREEAEGGLSGRLPFFINARRSRASLLYNRRPRGRLLLSGPIFMVVFWIRRKLRCSTFQQLRKLGKKRIWENT